MVKSNQTQIEAEGLEYSNTSRGGGHPENVQSGCSFQSILFW